FFRIEVRERAPIVLALAQDGPPAQAGLRAFEDQELEVPAVVAHGHAPFCVVIKLIRGIDVLAPGTAFHCVRHARVDSSAALPRWQRYRKLRRIRKVLWRPTRHGPTVTRSSGIRWSTAAPR